MKFKINALLIALMLGVFALMPSNAAAQTNPLKNIAVTDNAGNLTNGVLNITSFSVKKGKVMANGTLTGTTSKGAVNQAVSLPVNTAGQNSCNILNLQLGPLDLDLLGLRVQLSQIDLDITAEPGSGKLLGNLLCEVAKLLDGNGRALGKLAGLLNDILGALG